MSTCESLNKTGCEINKNDDIVFTIDGTKYMCFDKTGVCGGNQYSTHPINPCGNLDQPADKCIPDKESGGEGSIITAPTRKINILNKCDKPVRLISTLTTDPRFKQRFPNEFNQTYTGEDALNKTDYSKQYRTFPGALPSNMSSPTRFYEKLAVFDGDLGCPLKTPCRPGVNYEAVWEDISSDEVERMDHFQGKIEFTFGANGGTTDFMDLSGMVDSGCASHTAPYENDIGMHDSNQYCSTPVCNVNGSDKKCNDIPTDTTKWHKGTVNLAQVNHNMDDIYNIYTNSTWSSNNVPKKTDGSYFTYNASMGEGQVCLDQGSPSNPIWNSRMVDTKDCTTDNLKDKYVCGWPYKYYFEDKDNTVNTGVYTVDKVSDNLSWFKCSDFNDVKDKGYYQKYGDPTKQCPNCKVPNPCSTISSELNNKIMGSVRNDFYSCSLTQHSGINDWGKRTNYYNTDDKGKITNMIPFSLEAPPSNNCPKGEPMPRNCMFNPSDFTNPSSGCAGYTFAYDDAIGGYQCQVDPKIEIPEYTITFCPDHDPPDPPDTHGCGELPSNPPYGYWDSSSNNTKYANCDHGYKDNTMATPSIQCDSSTKIWSQAIPSTQGYCSQPCSPTQPTPTINFGKWKKYDTIYYPDCFNAKTIPDSPSPSMYCNDGNWIGPIPSLATDYCDKSCSLTELPTISNGEWTKDTDNTYKVTCLHGSKYDKYLFPIIKCVNGELIGPTPSLPPDYCNSISPPGPDPSDPSNPSDPSDPSDPTKHHHKKHDIYGSSRKQKIDYYDSKDRTNQLQGHYASIHGSYSTVEELNKLITEFYKPKCSLHLNVDDETLMNNPGLLQLREYPGVGHC